MCFLGFSVQRSVFSLLSSYFPSTSVLDLCNCPVSWVLPQTCFPPHLLCFSFQSFSIQSPHLCFSRLTPPAPHPLVDLFCISVQSSSSHPLCSHDPDVLVPWCSSVFTCSLYCPDALIILHPLLFLPAVSCMWLHLLCSGVIIMTGVPLKLSSPYMCGILYFKSTICNIITKNITC